MLSVSTDLVLWNFFLKFLEFSKGRNARERLKIVNKKNPNIIGGYFEFPTELNMNPNKLGLTFIQIINIYLKTTHTDRRDLKCYLAATSEFYRLCLKNN